MTKSTQLSGSSGMLVGNKNSEKIPPILHTTASNPSKSILPEATEWTTNRSKGPGRGRSKPLRRGDQTKAMTAGFWRVLVEIPSILPRPMARRRQYPSSWRADEHSDGGSGELSGDDLARSHGLVLPRSRGFGDKQPPKRSWATSSGAVLGRHAYLSGEFYPISVAPYSKCRGGLRDFRLLLSPLFPPRPSRDRPASSALRTLIPFPPGANKAPRRGGDHYFYPPRRGKLFTRRVPRWPSFPLHNTIRYSISLSEFRNLFSLNSNPKPDQGWLYFKARNKKFCSEDTPATLRGGRANKHCNNPPRLFDDEMKVFEEIFPGVKDSGRSSAERRSSELLERRGTELRRLLPHIPDLTLLRWTGGKVLDPILGNYLNVPSSNPSSESCSDSSQLVELESDAMSKRVSFKKIGEKLGKAAGASSRTPAPAKGVVIGEKRARESITSSPSKKAKADDGSKGKGVDIGPEGKKKGPRLISALFWAPRLLSWAARLLPRGCCGGREAGEQASLQQGRVASMETEVARLQKLAADFEQQLAESRAREQQSLDELAKAKGDRDSLADHLEKSGALVNELREALNKAKESAVEEFKSSSEFMVAVEDAASKYFGEGFNFCKVQLRRHHPDLAIDLEGTVVDQDLLAELDEAEEENDKEKTGEHEGVKNNAPR
ncbi:hypothetical protein Acr_17g0007760 [Actinidia rufa]|uniref:Uncharacterized protein n=1 Tax=Actinidia rufa TaxID=165716 RepID=A0A7J0G345_9ERIC|nr:hypothetical protein Acr_17g0007760 [Actinidia rufa]